MKKTIALIVAVVTIITTNSVLASSEWVVENKTIPSPFSVENTPVKENPYWLFYKIENTKANANNIDTGFIPIMGDMLPTKECRSEYSGAKPGCNKVDITWSMIGNYNTREISDERVVIFNLDLWKSLTRSEQGNLIKDISKNKNAILKYAYVMRENPKYYETKILSDDKSVYLLPLKEETKGLTFAFTGTVNGEFYKDPEGQYYKNFAKSSWYKIFRNEEYENKMGDKLNKCTKLDCGDVVMSIWQDTIAGKIMSHETENNPDEEMKALEKEIATIFDSEAGIIKK